MLGCKQRERYLGLRSKGIKRLIDCTLCVEGQALGNNASGTTEQRTHVLALAANIVELMNSKSV